MRSFSLHLMLTMVWVWVAMSQSTVMALPKEPISEVQEAAERGDPQAQFSLGLWYLQDTGGKKDAEQARRWWLKAAEQGHVKAQTNIGVMYERGEGVAKDDQQALAWYRKSAEQGYAPAQLNIGMNYLNGRGVPQDDKQAVTWFRKSAEQGNPQAQYNLGWMYSLGRGVEKNEEKAFEFWSKSANQNEVRAQFNLGIIYEEGHGVPKNVKQAAYWYKKAAELGDTKARTKLEQLDKVNGSLKHDGTPTTDSTLIAKQNTEEGAHPINNKQGDKDEPQSSNEKRSPINVAHTDSEIIISQPEFCYSSNKSIFPILVKGSGGNFNTNNGEISFDVYRTIHMTDPWGVLQPSQGVGQNVEALNINDGIVWRITLEDAPQSTWHLRKVDQDGKIRLCDGIPQRHRIKLTTTQPNGEYETKVVISTSGQHIAPSMKDKPYELAGDPAFITLKYSVFDGTITIHSSAFVTANTRSQNEAKLQKEKGGMKQQTKSKVNDQSQAAAASTKVEVEKYASMIKAKVERYMILKPSMRGKSCTLSVKLARSGVVLSVNNGQGDPEVCRFGKAAVLKVNQLPVPKDPAAFKILNEFNLKLAPNI